MYSKIKSPVKTSALSLKGKSNLNLFKHLNGQESFIFVLKESVNGTSEENTNNIKDYFHILIIHIKVW